MTEKELFIECIPQIAEMIVEVQKMTAFEYWEFKREYLEEVARMCPAALGFIKKILVIIEWNLAG